MTTLVSDSFNRANSTTGLGTSDTGQSWVAISGTYGINNNQAYSVSGGTAIAVVNASASDVDMQVDLDIPNSSYTVESGPCVRSTGTNSDCIFLRWHTGIGYELYTTVNGSSTKIAGDANTAQPSSYPTTLTLRIVAQGTSVTCYSNGSMLFGAAQTISSLSTNTYHGLRDLSDTTSTFDNFVVNSVGGSSPTPITASASFQGQGSLSATANIVNPATINATASFTGQGSLSATANLISPVLATASMQGQGSLTATGNGVWLGSASLTGQGSLSSNPVVVLTASASLSGQGSLTAVVELQDTSVIGTANFYGSSSVVSNPTVSKAPILATANMQGQGILTATVEVIDIGVANLQGTSYLMANAVLPAQVQVPKVWNTVFDPKKSWTGVFDKTVHTWTGVFDPKKVWVGGE